MLKADKSINKSFWSRTGGKAEYEMKANTKIEIDMEVVSNKT